jgi:hypothetical protein
MPNIRSALQTGPPLPKTRQPLPNTQSTVYADSANASKGLTIKQKIELSREQQRVLQMVVKEGKSVFFTGSAGEYSRRWTRTLRFDLRLKDDFPTNDHRYGKIGATQGDHLVAQEEIRS